MAHEPQRLPEDEFEPEARDSGEEEIESPPSASADLIGRTLEGRYRFDALVGEGTFARVFKVYDLNRRVFLAAKVLRSDIAHEPAFVERFKREAAVLARLQHPNIVRYYETVESDDTVFILTDYIEGRTLQSVLRRHAEPMSPEESLAYLRPLSAGLHFAHQEGIVHRDLKPSNILIDANKNLYITDFGIARILSDASTLTVDTTVGTPHYMSPEQIMIGEITAATDIYALGVMLYQMYTGRLPFTGESQGATGTTTAVRIVYEHLHVKPAPPTRWNPALTKAVEAVILRCLEKDPAQRYRSVSDAFDALNDAISAPSESLESEPAASALIAAEGERVPTDAGGMSRVAEADVLDVGGETLDESEPVYGGRAGRKQKRDERRARRKAKRQARAERESDEMSEKEREKKRESDEKNEEKQREKGWDTNVEKDEFWVDIGPSDRLSQFTWGGAVLWTGIALLLHLSPALPWIMSGAGALLLGEVAMRQIIPEYRSRPGSRLVFGSILLTAGLGLALGLESLWPLVLIAIGVSLLINRLLES
jgi:tRNA A-37 threonylcarbamoyl transferase component Bud32